VVWHHQKKLMKTAFFLSTLLLLIVCYYRLKSARDLHVLLRTLELNFLGGTVRVRKNFISSGWVAADRKAPHHDVGQIPVARPELFHPFGAICWASADDTPELPGAGRCYFVVQL
jgi:hypothetical protein